MFKNSIQSGPISPFGISWHNQIDLIRLHQPCINPTIPSILEIQVFCLNKIQNDIILINPKRKKLQNDVILSNNTLFTLIFSWEGSRAFFSSSWPPVHHALLFSSAAPLGPATALHRHSNPRTTCTHSLYHVFFSFSRCVSSTSYT